MMERTAGDWEQFLAQYPRAHLLQTTTWAEAKSGFGWQPAWVTVGDTGAQVLFRRLPLGLTIAYIPKGPLGPDWQSLWPAVDQACRKRRAVMLRVEPDEWEPARAILDEELTGFRQAASIQPRRTVVVSLEGTEEEWLARMKQKTRYNVRLAEKKEIQVAQSNDLETFYALMVKTGGRDGFGVHTLEYYRRVYELFARRGECALWMASFEGHPLAGLMVFRYGPRAWYLYGASSDEERNRMPTYLLQWQAMRWAAEQGAVEYDLYGVPDVDEERLESEFAGRNDGLWGVYRFKRGFGGEIRRTVGAWDRVYQPALYRLYQVYAARRGGESG